MTTNNDTQDVGRGLYRPRPSKDSFEWYTPEHIIQFARDVMGGISLDPASCQSANEIVKADLYYSKEDDGLNQSWRADTVFCNPPYGRGGMVGKWYEKMRSEWQEEAFREGLFLTNATTEVKWFQDALKYFPVLLISGRLKFWNPQRPDRNGFFGSALVYFPSSDDESSSSSVPQGFSPIAAFRYLARPLGYVTTPSHFMSRAPVAAMSVP